MPSVQSVIRDSKTSYINRLVEVPDPDTLNWPQRTAVASEKILDTVEDIEAMITERRFENVVKGGYMNMEIE